MTQVFRIIREHRIHHGDTEATEKSGKIDILSALSVSVVKYIFLSNRDGIDTSKRFITLKNLGDPHDLLGAKSLLALCATGVRLRSPVLLSNSEWVLGTVLDVCWSGIRFRNSPRSQQQVRGEKSQWDDDRPVGETPPLHASYLTNRTFGSSAEVKFTEPVSPFHFV